MKKKKKSIFRRIVSFLLIVLVIGVLIILGKTYQSIKRVEKYEPEITTAIKKYRVFGQGDHFNRIKRQGD